MTWKEVLNASANLSNSQQDMIELCLKSGYKFFAWNGQIYFVNSAGTMFETGLTVDSLSK